MRCLRAFNFQQINDDREIKVDCNDAEIKPKGKIYIFRVYFEHKINWFVEAESL